MIKFKVGQVYRNRINQLYEIINVYPTEIFAKNEDGNVLKFTHYGKFKNVSNFELNDNDLIELITNPDIFKKKLELEQLNKPSLDTIVLHFHKITDEEKIQFFNLLHSRIYQTILDYYNDIISMGDFESDCYNHAINILNIRDCNSIRQFIDRIENH